MRTMTRRRAVAAVSLAVAMAIGLGACGDDDDDDGASATAGATADADAQAAEYCEKALPLETAGEPDIDFETASDEEIAAASKAFIKDKIVPLVPAWQAAAPDEIEDDVAVLADALDESTETGEFPETPRVQAADDRVGEWQHVNCPWDAADVTGTEYAFAGLDQPLEAGPVSFRFTNNGKEQHELVVVQRKPGVTESLDAILELPQDQAEAKVDAHFLEFLDPGESGYGVLDLDPGEYMAVCFVPMGSTPAAAEQAHETGQDIEGPPHFTQGMRATFTVR